MDGGDVEQRLVDPAPQQPRAHRRECGVEHAQQTAGHFAAAHRFGQLQVAPRRFVERHKLAQGVGGQLRHLVAHAGLHCGDVSQHACRCPQCVESPVQAKAVECGDAEVPFERRLRCFRLDLPGFDVGDQRVKQLDQPMNRCMRRLPIDGDQLARLQARQFLTDALLQLFCPGGGDLRGGKFAGGDVAIGDARSGAAPPPRDCHQVVVAPFVQHARIDDGAFGDDAAHFALHQSFAWL